MWFAYIRYCASLSGLQKLPEKMEIEVPVLLIKHCTVDRYCLSFAMDRGANSEMVGRAFSQNKRDHDGVQQCRRRGFV